MLEVAEAFAALEERPARSLIFLAVSGEEKGLLGSRAFANDPPVPIGSIVANINMDMISRNTNHPARGHHGALTEKSSAVYQTTISRVYSQGTMEAER